MIDKPSDKPENYKIEENSQENPAPFFEAVRDMFRIGLPQAMASDFFETVTAARKTCHVVGQEAFARLHDTAMEEAYANYE